MKVLKSGVEMTPEDLSRLKGGACACGCDWSAEMVHAVASTGGSCLCTCKEGGGESNNQGMTDAASYI